MKINGVELQDLDLLDLGVAEKYEAALKTVDNMEERVRDMTIAESVRTQCTAIFNVFNMIFGKGTDKKIFGEKVNLLTCLKAFEELVIYSRTPNKELTKLTQKYSPNRATRRSKK